MQKVFFSLIFFDFFRPSKNIQEGLQDLQDIAMQNHGGTFHGLAEHLLKNGEKYANALLEELMDNVNYTGPKIDVRHSDNKLQDKLTFLYGRQSAMLMVVGKKHKKQVQSNIKVLSTKLFNFLDSFREGRNDEAHDRDFVYNVVESFEFLRIRFESGNWCEFFPKGKVLRFLDESGKPLKLKPIPCEAGLDVYASPMPKEHVADLEPCQLNMADLIIHILSPHEVSEFHKDKILPQGNSLRNVIAIFWGKKKFFIPVNRGGADAFTKATKIENKDHKRLYFQLNVMHTLKRVLEIRDDE